MIRAGRLVCAALLVLSSLLLSKREARAARMVVTLAYAADAGCPDATEFKAVVVGRLGYDPFIDGSTDHVLVRLERRAGAGGSEIHGRIEWRDAAGKWTGEQSFPSASSECSGLARAVGFALAVQIQFLATANPGSVANGSSPGGLGASPPVAGGGRSVPSPSPAPPADRPPATEREATRPEAERPREGEPPAERAGETVASPEAPPERSGGPGPTFAIGVGPSLGLGLSSSPVALGRLFGALHGQHVSIEIGGLASAPTTVRRADGAGVRQHHFFGSAALCAGDSRWSGCLLVNAGQVRMSGQNIDRPTSANVALLQVGLRAALTQPLGRWAFVDAHADGLINVTRWTGSLDQVPVWTAPRFGAALGIDAGFRFR